MPTFAQPVFDPDKFADLDIDRRAWAAEPAAATVAQAGPATS